MKNYSLYKNNLTTNDENDYIARTIHATIRTKDQLIEQITGPGSILKETECNAVIDNYWQGIINFLSEGSFYKDKYIHVRIDIIGVFDGEDDRFDSERHDLKITITPSSELKSALAEMPLQYVKPEKTLPEIEHVYDWGSNTTNDIITPNDTIEIKGDNLKLYEEEDAHGVFFIHGSSGTEVQASNIRTNEPKTLTLRVPTLDAGDYRIEVRNASWKSKTLRVAISNMSFSVQ